jgi:CHAD domain-containing protein
MAGELKWVAGVSGSTPVVKVAHLSCADRFAMVESAWLAALEQPREPAHIHHLRVATRRATATIRVFEDLIPSRKATKLQKLLHQLRRAAGTARDEDIFAKRLRDWAKSRGEDDRPGLDWLAGTAVADRAKSRIALRATRELRDHWRKLVSFELNSKSTKEKLAERAANQIPARIAKFEKAAAREIENPKQLHRLRIAAKRLRYALELLGPGLPGADLLCREVKNVQEMLGSAQDARVISGRLADQLLLLETCSSELRMRYQPGVVGLKNVLEAEVAAAPGKFREWHRHWSEIVATLKLTRSDVA